MKITGYESENGNVTAITVTDETRGFYDKRFVPERPHGEWIGNRFGIQCSECGLIRNAVPYEMNFCPSCGADMRPREGDRNE